MLKTVMAKLDTLDDIQKRIVCVEQDFKQMKTSLEFAHAEVKDLKVERTKKSENEILNPLARSMRDNLLFYNVEEEERENRDEKNLPDS
jgi:NAD-specific glutamate dehydrogenase